MTGIIRGRRLLLASAIVVALAAIIFIGGALSQVGEAPKGSRRASDPSDYRAALLAESSGDTTRAAQLLERVVAREPGNREAKSALDRVRKAAETAAEPPAGGEQDPVAPGPGEPDPYLATISDLGKLLPGSIAGYAVTGKLSDSKDAQLTLEPVSGSALYRRVSVAAVSVRDQGSPSAARAFVDGHGKAFPVGLATVSIGSREGKSGCDRERLAAVSFARGRFSFEVVLTSASEDPSSFTSEAARIASLIPAAH